MRARNMARINGIPQSCIPVDSGVPEIAHGREAALKVLTRQLRADQYALAGRLDDRQQQIWNEVSVVAARALGRRWYDYVKEQVGVRVNQAGQQGGAPQIDCFGAGRYMRLQLRG